MSCRWRFAVMTAALAMFAVGVAPAVADTYRVYGAGAASCQAWLSETDQRELFLSWIFGFFTALNMADADDANSDVLKDAGATGVEGWFDDHCKSHQDDNLAQAAEALFLKLYVPKFSRLGGSDQ